MKGLTLLGGHAGGERSVTEVLFKERLCLGEVCAEVGRWLGETGPTVKMSSTLGDLLPPTNQNQVHSLEDVYDRVQIFLHLLVEFINQIPQVAVVYGKSNNTKTGHWIGVSALSEKLWRRLKLIHHLFNVSAGDGKGTAYTKVSTNSRDWLPCCESCKISQALIRLLVTNLTAVDPAPESAVSKYKEKMKDDIFKLSQVEAMRGWCKAIAQDTSRLWREGLGRRELARKLARAKVQFAKRKMRYRRRVRNLKFQLNRALINTKKGNQEKLTEEIARLKIKINDYSEKINFYKSKMHDYGEAIITLNGMKENLIKLEENKNTEIEKLKKLLNAKPNEFKELPSKSDQHLLEQKVEELIRKNNEKQGIINDYLTIINNLEKQVENYAQNEILIKQLILKIRKNKNKEKCSS